jgi:hypothetical protein
MNRTDESYFNADQPSTNPSRLISPIVGLCTISETASIPMSSMLTPISPRYFAIPSMRTESGELGSSAGTECLINNFFQLEWRSVRKSPITLRSYVDLPRYLSKILLRLDLLELDVAGAPLPPEKYLECGRIVSNGSGNKFQLEYVKGT